MNRVFKTYDSALELRDIGDGAVTATASGTGIAFDPRHIDGYKAIFQVSALDATDGNETYALSIEVSDLVGGTYTSLGSLTLTGVGTFELPLSGNLASFKDADSAFIRVTATLGGTTPSITYGAYLTRM